MNSKLTTNQPGAPAVSVALASYNGEKYIEEQLASLISQTRMPDEVIISDDGSTDATVALCERFRDTTPFHVEIHVNQKNLGVTGNFENALRHCHGDIIFLSDQDDAWFPSKLEVITGLFEANPTILAITNDAVICDENLTPTKYTQIKQNLAIGRPESGVISGCCSAFRREFLEIALPVPEAAAAHDNWLNGLADLLSVRMICRETLQYYRRHGGNESHDLSSRAERLSTLSLIRQYGLADATPVWRGYIAVQEAYLERVRAMASRIRALGLPVEVEDVVGGIQSKIDAIRNRLQLVEKPRWKRLFPVLQTYATGGYRHFHGVKSAVKDILRP